MSNEIFKYETSKHTIDIKKVEITKETDKTIWIKVKDFRGKVRIDQVRKNSEYNQYHSSFQDAKDYLIKMWESRIEYIEENLKKRKEELNKINNLSEINEND